MAADDTTVEFTRTISLIEDPGCHFSTVSLAPIALPLTIAAVLRSRFPR